mgnify:CR=1 FL=1
MNIENIFSPFPTVERSGIFNKKGELRNATAMQTSFSNSSMLSQVVGVIIGSPEFQRR